LLRSSRCRRLMACLGAMLGPATRVKPINVIPQVEYMEDPQLYGLYMACIWLVYGLYMACIWLVYGLYMACIWLVYPNGVRIGQASIDWCCEHNQLGQI